MPRPLIIASGIIISFCFSTMMVWGTGNKVWTFSPTHEEKPTLTVQLGNRFGVTHVTISRDNRYALTSGGVIACLWNIESGNELKRFSVNEVLSWVGFSTNNKYAITVSEHLIVWDIRSGTEVRRIEGSVFAVSPDGRYAAAGTTNNTITVFDLESGEEIRRLAAHASPVTKVAFSPDNKFILTATGTGTSVADDQTRRKAPTETQLTSAGRPAPKSSGRTASLTTSKGGRVAALSTAPIVPTAQDFGIELWNFDSGEMNVRFDDNTSEVLEVSFSSDARLILTANRDGAAYLWDTTTGTQVRQLHVPTAALSPDGKLILTGARRKEFSRILVVSTGEELWKETDNGRGPQETNYVAFSPDGKNFMIGSEYGNYIRVFETANRRETHTFKNKSGISCVAFSPDGQLLLSGNGDYGAAVEGLPFTDGQTRVWNVNTGDQLSLLKGKSSGVTSVLFSPDSRYLITGSEDSAIHLWDIANGQLKTRFKYMLDEYGVANVGDASGFASISGLAYSSNGKQIVSIDSGGYLHFWNTSTGNEVKHAQLGRELYSLSTSRNGMIVTYDPWRMGYSEKGVMLLNALTLNTIRTFDGYFAALAPDGRSLLISSDSGVSLVRATSGSVLQKFEGETPVALSPRGSGVLTTTSRGVNISGSKNCVVHIWNRTNGNEITSLKTTRCLSSPSFSSDGQRVLTTEGTEAQLWDAATGVQLQSFAGHTDIIEDATISNDGRLVATVSMDSTTRLWRVDTGKEVCRLITFANGNWIVVAPDGRFDTNNLESIDGIRWLMPDDPLTALPVEIFMRPYYEPRLLSRLLANDDFKEVPSLADLNRVQPVVIISDVKKDGPDTVTVTVDVECVEHKYQREKNPVVESGAKDLRLFRDGQLVSYRDGDLLDLQTTSAAGCGPVAGSAKKYRAVFEHISLPRQEGVKDVEFSAYAFNTSNVKSETYRFPFKFTPELPARKGRVYLITVGVSNYENAAWNLEFAANDAHLVHDSVGAKLRATKEYDDVVDVMLTAEEKMVNGQKVVSKTATKENFRKIMRLLAGEKLSESETKEIPNAQKVEKTSPEDVVLIFYSSHGYRDTERFYLFPFDTGPGQGRDPVAVVHHSISSDDLYQWLRDIDAGDLVLVIDACHAAAVTGKEFKPGPMGSHGMGQLAYDKGMRILAATQPDTTAAEVDSLDQGKKIQHGLLTYALVADGLMAGRADTNKDKVILLPEWLEYSVTDVPKLYEEALKSRNSPKRGAGQVRFISKGKGNNTTQQPSLFDFAERVRKKRQLAIDKSLTHGSRQRL